MRASYNGSLSRPSKPMMPVRFRSPAQFLPEARIARRSYSKAYSVGGQKDPLHRLYIGGRKQSHIARSYVWQLNTQPAYAKASADIAGRAEAARRAHNPKVPGSNPGPATTRCA